jgi:hypothetical protein
MPAFLMSVLCATAGEGWHGLRSKRATSGRRDCVDTCPCRKPNSAGK